MNPEANHNRHTLDGINAINQEFWRKRAEKLEADDELASEAYCDLLEQFDLKVPFHLLRSFDVLLDKADARVTSHRTRFLREVRRENGRQGGKARKPDSLQCLIEQIVMRNRSIDCAALLRSLENAVGAGVVEEICDGEISFTDSNGRSKSVKLTSLKDRLYRAKKKPRSQKAVSANQS